MIVVFDLCLIWKDSYDTGFKIPKTNEDIRTEVETFRKLSNFWYCAIEPEICPVHQISQLHEIRNTTSSRRVKLAFNSFSRLSIIDMLLLPHRRPRGTPWNKNHIRQHEILIPPYILVILNILIVKVKYENHTLFPLDHTRTRLWKRSASDLSMVAFVLLAVVLSSVEAVLFNTFQLNRSNLYKPQDHMYAYEYYSRQGLSSCRKPCRRTGHF